MLDSVKNPKVPHQGGGGGGVGRAELYSAMILNYTRGQKYTYFQNNTIHSFKSMYGRRNLVSGTPSPHIHTDTYLHIHRFKKLILVSMYPTEVLTVLAMYHHLTSRYPSRSFFPVCRSSPTSRCPKPIAPAACGMAIREQT